MRTNKQIENTNLVEQINIVHNFEIVIKDYLLECKELLKISETTKVNKVLELLETKGYENQHFKVKSLVDTYKLIKFKEWVDKTN